MTTETTSQYFYNDDTGRSRVKRDGPDWFLVQWKSAGDVLGEWQTYLVGTASWLGLTAQDVAWAK